MSTSAANPSGVSAQHYDKPTELQISSARFDRDAQGALPPRLKLIICSTPRSGSYLLCRQLINAGIGVPHEYFNPVHLDLLRRRWELKEDDTAGYLRGLYRRRTTANGVWGLKLQWPQYLDHSRDMDAALDRAACYVFLRRNDIPAQAASMYASLSTGVWGFDGLRTTPVMGAEAHDHPAHLALCMESIARQNAAWSDFFSARGVTPLNLGYEELIRNQGESVRRIAAALGLQAGEYTVPPAEEHERFQVAGSVFRP